MNESNPSAPSAQKTALFSVALKTLAFLDFARNLVSLGWSLLGSKGTAAYLNEHDVPCKDVADIVGPPILKHKVVTLSREVHAALLADLNDPEEMAELARIGIAPIHLVYVDMYPLKAALDHSARTRNSVIETIDIGGPTMLRSAAKGGRIVISDAGQFTTVLMMVKDTLDGVPENDERIVRAKAHMAADAEGLVSTYTELAESAYNWIGNGCQK